MRLYTFINAYLSQIQQGIQTAHIVHELFNKYKTDQFLIEAQGTMLNEWSREHKTIIVLNGGVDQQIEELMQILDKYEFPFEQFVEDEGLCKARTGCGVVLPDWIYEAERKFDKDALTVYYQHVKHHVENEEGSRCEVKTFYPGDKYFDLIEAVKSKRLA